MRRTVILAALAAMARAGTPPASGRAEAKR